MELKPIRTDDQSFGRSPASYEAADIADVAQGPQSANRVLRNTYLLLAVTMVPTIIGAFLGIQFAGVMMASPIITMVAMLVSVIGLQFAIVRYRNSAIGVGLLLLMTLLMGVFLGPLLNVALQMRNGMQLVGYAAAGTGIIFFGMGALA